MVLHGRWPIANIRQGAALPLHYQAQGGGRAERDEHVQGVEAAEIDVRLREDPRSKEQLLRDIRGRLSAVPGVQFTLGQPISHRIDHMISGQRAELSLKVIGENLSDLRRHAE